MPITSRRAPRPCLCPASGEDEPKPNNGIIGIFGGGIFGVGSDHGFSTGGFGGGVLVITGSFVVIIAGGVVIEVHLVSPTGGAILDVTIPTGGLGVDIDGDIILDLIGENISPRGVVIDGDLIPYLYVDGLLDCDSDTTIILDAGTPVDIYLENSLL